MNKSALLTGATSAPIKAPDPRPFNRLAPNAVTYQVFSLSVIADAAGQHTATLRAEAHTFGEACHAVAALGLADKPHMLIMNTVLTSPYQPVLPPPVERG